MRTENEEIRDHLKYLALLARDYPSQAAAASEIISTQALLKLPKGTEHFMSDLHGENEAFVHILNSASGVIREKVDIVLGEIFHTLDQLDKGTTLCHIENTDTPAIHQVDIITLVPRGVGNIHRENCRIFASIAILNGLDRNVFFLSNRILDCGRTGSIPTPLGGFRRHSHANRMASGAFGGGCIHLRFVLQRPPVSKGLIRVTTEKRGQCLISIFLLFGRLLVSRIHEIGIALHRPTMLVDSASCKIPRMGDHDIRDDGNEEKYNRNRECDEGDFFTG